MYQAEPDGGRGVVNPFFELAEAIREGCKQTVQIQKEYFVEADGVYGTCALGAALYARGYRFEQGDEGVDGIAAEWFPALDRVGLIEHIISLNDEKGYTREQIADWVEYKAERMFDV